MERVSVVGLGKLGQCLAGCLAVSGFETIGVDIDGAVVDSINRGEASVVEPGLQDLISEAGDSLKATVNHDEAISNTDVTFILLPTPSNADGYFSNDYLGSALRSASVALKRSGKDYHLFVVSSTVMPGTVENRLIPIVEEISDRKLDAGFGMCYCPELVALGSVIKDFRKPDLIILGQSNDYAGDRVVSIYRSMCENDPPIFQMSYINAEIAKVSLNCYITMKISFANSMSNLCEKIPGADVDAITEALGADKRIAPYYLRGGPSYGGPCFPRDTRAFIAFANEVGNGAELVKAVESVNDFQDSHLAELVMSHALSVGDDNVSILGLSFKPGVPVIDESPAIKLIHELIEKDINIHVFDPLAMEKTREIFGDRINYTGSLRDCLSRSGVCVLTTPSEEYRGIDSDYIGDNPKVVIDCWRVLYKEKLGRHVNYVALGQPGIEPDRMSDN